MGKLSLRTSIHKPDEHETMALTLEREKVLDGCTPFRWPRRQRGSGRTRRPDRERFLRACGSCPSSTMTLKMGIERKMRESIPEVSEVIQVL